MRAPRVSCKLCGHRGSVNNKVLVHLWHHDVYLCLPCRRAVIVTEVLALPASTDPGTQP